MHSMPFKSGFLDHFEHITRSTSSQDSPSRIALQGHTEKPKAQPPQRSPKTTQLNMAEKVVLKNRMS